MHFCLRSRPVDPDVVRPLVCQSVSKWPRDRVTKWPSDLVTKWPNNIVTKWQEASQTIDRMVYFLFCSLFLPSHPQYRAIASPDADVAHYSLFIGFCVFFRLTYYSNSSCSILQKVADCDWKAYNHIHDVILLSDMNNEQNEYCQYEWL